MATRGRKNKYQTHIYPRLDDITEWVSNGATEKNICRLLGVGESTFNKYKNERPELVEALNKGRQVLVSDLRGALIKKALGFTYLEEEHIEKDKDGFIEKVDRIVKKYAVPDTGAIHLLLKNYDRQNWSNDWSERERKDAELELKKKMAQNSIW